MTNNNINMTCAKCGKKGELCNSLRVEGIQQPRICEECLLETMSTGDETINYIYWIMQLVESDDQESIKAINESTEMHRKNRDG